MVRPAQWAMPSEGIEGDEWGAYVVLSSWTKIFMYIIILILIDTESIELLRAETSGKKAKMIHAIYASSPS